MIALDNRIPGIGDQIEKNLLQIEGPAPHPTGPVQQLNRQLNLLERDLTTGQGDRVLDHAHQLQTGTRGLVLAVEQPQMLDNTMEPLRLVVDAFQLLVHILLRVFLRGLAGLHGVFRRHGQGIERLGDLMGDPRHHLANGGQLG